MTKTKTEEPDLLELAPGDKIFHLSHRSYHRLVDRRDAGRSRIILYKEGGIAVGRNNRNSNND